MAKIEIELTINPNRQNPTATDQTRLLHLAQAYAHIIKDLSASKLKTKIKSTDDSHILTLEGHLELILSLLPIMIAVFSGDDEVVPISESKDGDGQLSLIFAFYEILTEDI